MEDFVSFEIAKKLEEKGFKEKCLCHYIRNDLIYNIESPIANNQLWFCHNQYDNIWHRDNVDAPTISQVLKWLREKKKYYVYAAYGAVSKFRYVIIQLDNEDAKYTIKRHYKTYEDAIMAGINYVINNII